MDRTSVDWRGYIPAVTTPFDEELRFDRAAQCELLDWFAQEELHGLIVGGTNGEWFTMTSSERHEQFRLVGARLKGRMTLIAGCNAFTAAQALDLAAVAAAAGFDGILVSPPAYIVPNEAELYGFYAAISAGSPLPICVYNWARGTNVDMSLALLDRLARLDKVVALKNSTPDLGHFVHCFFALRDRLRIFGFPTDDFGISMVGKEGGDGLMGAGAVLGRNHPEFFNAIWRGDLETARAVGAMDRAVMTELFHADYSSVFASPQAVLKAALNLQGVPGGHVRPPLADLTEPEIERVRAVLKRVGRVLV